MHGCRTSIGIAGGINDSSVCIVKGGQETVFPIHRADPAGTPKLLVLLPETAV
jgi:hypothetical protein